VPHERDEDHGCLRALAPNLTGNYPSDAASNAAAEVRHVIEKEMIGTRATGLPDTLAKVKVLREHARGGIWIHTDEMLASIAADLEHVTTASPELVALASEHAAVVDRYNKGDGKDGGALTKQIKRMFAKIEAFVPHSIADVLVKCHVGETNYGEGIPKKGEEMYASDRILLQMIADLEHLAGKGGAS
jgi:hypothetical protein